MTVNEMTAKTGYFVFSLDTELAWGYFDKDEVRRNRFSPDGARERESISRLLDVLDEFGISATWACVGHMFYESCEHCSTCPILDWKGRYGSFEEVYETSHPLWYGADVIDQLLKRGARHEIAFHGYTHEVFDERTMSEHQAKTEIREWLRVAERRGVVPRSVVFPRNVVGHLPLLEESGLLCFRGAEPASDSGVLPYLGRIRRRLRQVPFVFAPPVYDLPSPDPSGLLNLPASPNYFKRSRGLGRLFDVLNLTKLSMSGAIRGVTRAAKESKVVHVWSHPCEFQTDKDWAKLRHLFSHVSEHVSRGALQSVTMEQLARKARLQNAG